jgi:hypothetical protein
MKDSEEKLVWYDWAKAIGIWLAVCGVYVMGHLQNPVLNLCH